MPPFTFPTPYVWVAAWLRFASDEGKSPVTLRGYKAAIKWINGIVGEDNWNSTHMLLTSVIRYAKLHSNNSIRKDKYHKKAISLNQKDIIYVWNRYINESALQYRGAVISFVLGILTSARPSQIYKTRDGNKGLRFKDILWIYYKQNKMLQEKYGCFPPIKSLKYIKGIQFRYWNVKVGSTSNYIVRHVGRTMNDSIDPVKEFLIYLRLIYISFPEKCKEDNYVFLGQNGRPILYSYIISWIKSWREDLAGYYMDQILCILPHSMRKTFVNILFARGWEDTKLATYGDWASNSAIPYYYQYSMEEAFEIAKLILISNPKSNLKNFKLK